MADEQYANDLLRDLAAPFSDRALKSRKGSGGHDFRYVEAETVIRRLNRVAVGWDFRITDRVWREFEQANKDGVLKRYVNLITFGEMTIPGLGTRAGTGVQIFEDQMGSEDMIKGSSSDCLKNCAKLFGVAIDLYGPDLEGGADSEAVVDSRVEFASTRGRRMDSGYDGPPRDNRGGSPQLATPRQIKFIQAIAREHGIGDDDLNAEVEQLYGRPVGQLDRRDASSYIERLQSRGNVSQGL